MVPNARFTELLTDIEPSPTTTGNASSAHTGVREHLEGHETFSDRWGSSFLSGSYAHTRWSSERNAAFDGRFKKLVKLLKWWRRQNPSGKRPKGFVLEVLVALHAPRNETHFGEAFAQLLESIHGTYAYQASIGQKPFIADPAAPENDILAKVTVAQWKDFIEKVRVHADYARRAQNETDMEEATRLWRKVFGDRFKTTANPAKAANYSGYAAAAAPAGYTFPDAIAAPTKPRGFA